MRDRACGLSRRPTAPPRPGPRVTDTCRHLIRRDIYSVIPLKKTSHVHVLLKLPKADSLPLQAAAGLESGLGASR